jgi:2-polyprenyl-3-methyl-5-hydroxy-6-metoxy-1,4-benzoquinol methylase
VSNEVLGGRLSPWLSRQRMRQGRPYLRGRVLDYGCHDGTLAADVPADRYVGVDIHLPSLAEARARHPLHTFVTEVSDDERFDTIIGLAFIEHVPDPGGFLARFAGMLRPGGRIVLTTPHPWFEWVHTAGAKVKLFSAHAHEEHEELIDRPTMERLCARAGLRIERYRRFQLGANQLFVLVPAAAPAPGTPGTAGASAGPG